MTPDQMLVPFSWLFIAFLGLLVLVPYLRGKSDILNAWTLFLVGSANFVGVAGLKAIYSKEHFRVLEYTDEDYTWFMLGVLTFYGTVVLTYYRLKLPRRTAGRVLRKWPPATIGALSFMLPIALLLSLGMLYPPPIQFFAQLFTTLGDKAAVIALVLAFVAWYGQRANPVLLGMMAAVLLLSLVFAVRVGGGRRTLLGVLVAIPLCMYWLRWRYKNPLTNLAWGGLAAVALVLVLGAYSGIRHFDRRGERLERNLVNSFNALMKIPQRLLDPSAESVEGLLGQNAAQTSLAAIHLYTGELKPEPFHTVFFVISNPVPRALWRDKPKGLGYTLPKSARAYGTRATWGPGIVGHGFHEGGLHMLVFYGLICGFFLRLFDELLVRQPGNPYILGMLAASSGHIIGWPRGDIGTFTLQIIGGVLAGIVVAYSGRLLFGTGLVYPRTDHLEARYVQRGGVVSAVPA